MQSHNTPAFLSQPVDVYLGIALFFAGPLPNPSSFLEEHIEDVKTFIGTGLPVYPLIYSIDVDLLIT